ncbi:MAG: DUF2855 family protein [Parvibaculum sp.]|nr:DUF2855 family protein [Parvibaculum sp.]
MLVEIEKFALSANNITYAVAGDMLNYWSFFPAEEGWGKIPVWGSRGSRSRSARALPRASGYMVICRWPPIS